MKDNKVETRGEDIQMSNFSQVISLIFVTVVIIGSVISILFF